MIRLAKWGLFLLGLGWAGFSSYYVWLLVQLLVSLSRSFPTPEPTKFGLSELGKSLLLFAVVFGPVIIASALLAIRWPERAKDKSST